MILLNLCADCALADLCVKRAELEGLAQEHAVEIAVTECDAHTPIDLSPTADDL